MAGTHLSAEPLCEPAPAQTPPSAERFAEFELVRLCCTVTVDEGRSAEIARCSSRVEDWVAVVTLAEHHAVLPLLARNVLAHGRNVPLDVTRSLESKYQENLRRNLWFAAELARVADRLEKHAVQAVPYKGPLLSESVYGD